MAKNLGICVVTRACRVEIPRSCSCSPHTLFHWTLRVAIQSMSLPVAVLLPAKGMGAMLIDSPKKTGDEGD